MPDESKNYEEVKWVNTKPWVPLPEDQWTEPERWVWERVRTGEGADFNERYELCLLPWVEEAWTEEEIKIRGLRPDFLRTILLAKPWRGLITNFGVRIRGACFFGEVNLSNSEVDCELWLDASLLPAGLNCSNTQFKYNLSLRSSNLTQQLSMEGASVAAGLYMKEGKFMSALLPAIEVGGVLDMRGAELKGELAMDRAVIKVGLFMNEGKFMSARMHLAQVDGVLDMREVEFQEKLTMDGASITVGLFMNEGKFKSARLHVVQVGGPLTMQQAEFEKPVSMERLRVRGDLHLRGAKFKKGAGVCYATVGGHILCEETEFESLNLSDTKADAFYDGKLRGSDEDIWPDDLNLDRFTYNHLRGDARRQDTLDLTDRPASWFATWLAKQKKYSPLPYQQCAKVLREAGQPGKANEVLYAGKERERLEAAKKGEKGRYWWLTFLWATIGYGLGKRFFRRPAIIAGILWVVGLIFCLATPEADKHSFFWSMGFSLNRLIPLVDLHPTFKTAASLNFFPAAWFMFQTLCGWFLAALVIAGLAGVGKPGGRES
jgi:hypothetical protein